MCSIYVWYLLIFLFKKLIFWWKYENILNVHLGLNRKSLFRSETTKSHAFQETLFHQTSLFKWKIWLLFMILFFKKIVGTQCFCSSCLGLGWFYWIWVPILSNLCCWCNHTIASMTAPALPQVLSTCPMGTAGLVLKSWIELDVWFLKLV